MKQLTKLAKEQLRKLRKFSPTNSQNNNRKFSQMSIRTSRAICFELQIVQAQA